ncbi:hypothetical protein EYC84_006438 [Monilinia fructicola]|uniref:Uncharacterized protein n=1 Tax=Monilinia fructicola TaxID=38448 RepID=A0A5M9K3C3_MONFR|nr:hypothetical protein EYC84_006438 [Monilinia fructicola]
MQLHPFLLIPFLTLLTNAQSIPFPSINIDIPSIPAPPSFAAPPDLASGQSSSTSFSSSSSSSAHGQGGSTISQIRPVGNVGLLGGNADLAASGTAGSTVVVTGVPTETAKATKAEEASSVASGGFDGMGRIMILTLVTVMGALTF